MTFELALVLATALLVIPVHFAFLAITVPIRVRFKNSMSTNYDFEPLNECSLARDVERLIDVIKDLGFVVRGHWEATGHSRATGKITLMEKTQTLYVAKILVTKAGKTRHVTLLFQARFEDGTEINTANNQVTAGLPPLPECTTLWLPRVRDAKELYRIHFEFTNGLRTSKKRLSIGNDPLSLLVATRTRMLDHFVETGYYHFDEQRSVYRPTWKGAFLMSWRQIWPIRPLFRAWRYRRTHQLLREHGIQLSQLSS
jgi:hypothetical protein